MKYATIYKRRGQLFIGAQSMTSAGVLIGTGDIVVLDDSADVGTIGSKLCEVLNNSKSPVRHPEPSEWTAIIDRFLHSTGVKTWGSFVRGAVLTIVESDGKVILLQPHENRGARDAFQPMGLATVTIPATASAAEIGMAAITSLDLAASRKSHM